MMKFLPKATLGSTLFLVFALIACGDDTSGSPTSDASSPSPDAAGPSTDASSADADRPSTDSSPPLPDTCDPPAAPDHLYSMSAETFATPSETRSMCDYRGDVLLIVNVAALCTVS